MSSKLIGPESNFFSTIVVEAVEAIKITNLLGESKYPIKNVKIIKSHGQSSMQSQMIKGYVLQTQRAC